MDTKPETPAAPPSEKPRRIIKRYSNRKLYDTKDSRYVTLLQIAEMVRAGEEVQIIDNNTKDDLTEVTLAQIIYEEQKAHSPQRAPADPEGADPRADGEGARRPARGPHRAAHPGRQGGRGEGRDRVPSPPRTSKPTLVDQAKEKLEEVQHKLDERVSAVLRELPAACSSSSGGQTPERAYRGAREASSRAAARTRD